jgi:cellulose biosynthesis protein BcsQ
LDFSVISKRDDLQTVTSLSKYKHNFNEYEYVIIDSPPNIQSPVEAAIIASDYFLFVARARKWAFNGVDLINKTIKEINSAYQADKCKIIGCVINQFKRTHNLDKNLLEESELLLKGVKPLNTIIPNYLQYSEAIDNRAAFFSSFIKPKYQKILKTFVLEVTNEIKR